MADQVDPKELKKLRKAAIESTVRCETFAHLAQQKLSALEKTRRFFRELKTNLDYLKGLDEAASDLNEAEDEETAKDNINICLQSLARVKDELNKHQKDFKLIRSKLNLALALAKQQEHLLSETQRELLKNIQFPLEEEQESMVVQPKDDRATKFFDKLSQEDQVKFEELRQKLFVDAFIKKGHIMKEPEMFPVGDTVEIESLIATRIATYAFSRGNRTGKNLNIPELRVKILEQLEEEKKADIEAIGGTRESLSSPEGVNLNEVELAAQEILQRVAIESVDKTNELVNQGQQKLAELEHTKKNIQQFESDLQFLKELEEGAWGEYKSQSEPMLKICFGNLTNAKIELHEQQRDYKEIRKKIDLAIELAMQHDNLLSELVQNRMEVATAEDIKDAAKERQENAEKPRGRRPLIPYISTSLNCEPLLKVFYNELKEKHFSKTDYNNFIKNIVEKAAKQRDPKKLDKVLTIQLKAMLENKNS